METLKRANVIVSFLIELAMLLAFAYWGFRTGQNLWLKLALGLGVPLVVIVVWGLFLAPRAGYRADTTLGVVMTSGLFYLAAFALLHAGQPVLCAAMMAAAAVNRTLVVVWKQW